MVSGCLDAADKGAISRYERVAVVAASRYGV
jgi:hypothetical protein